MGVTREVLTRVAGGKHPGSPALTPKQRAVVALAALGYSARAIGELLGIPEGTAATRLKRARWAWERAKGKRKE